MTSCNHPPYKCAVLHLQVTVVLHLILQEEIGMFTESREGSLLLLFRIQQYPARKLGQTFGKTAAPSLHIARLIVNDGKRQGALELKPWVRGENAQRIIGGTG